MDLTPDEEIELLQLLAFEDQDKLFEAQPGPQQKFLECTADIALFGGAAGGGKTWALLLENLRHVANPKFGSVIFRRNANQVMTEGGLWDNARDLYPLRGATPKLTPRPVMVFPSGSKVSFAHLQYEDDVLAWQGSQVALICWDELCHFTRRQFFYMLSRNRSTCGVRPYMRATCNPDADSWVAKFIDWWIDDDGYPIPERSGTIRYFVVVDDDVMWGDSRDELADVYSVRPEDAKSFTFIASKLTDNKILMQKDPAYESNLKALGSVERGRLLDGNWKVRAAAGLYFPRDKVQPVPVVPGNVVAACRGWDLAATTPTPANPSPDRTWGVLMGRLSDGRYIVLDAVYGAWNADTVRGQVLSKANADREAWNSRVRLPQDPGQAGKEQALSYVRMLAGHAVTTERVSGSKVTRAEPLSSQWQAGNVLILQGDWNDAYLTEMEGFPDAIHEDAVDASGDAFAEVALILVGAGTSVEPDRGDYRMQRPTSAPPSEERPRFIVSDD